MTPVVTSPAMAARLEALEALNLRRQIEALAPEGRHRWEAIPGGVAGFCKITPDRKLNHVVGLGMDGPVDEAVLARLEAAYDEIGAAPEVDLCPHAHASALTALAARGWRTVNFSNTYALVLTGDEAAPGGGIEMRPVEDEAAFIATSADGFGGPGNPRPRELLEMLAVSALRRPDVLTYVAWLDGRAVGTAAMAVMGKDGHLFLASTLPEARGRGVQAAMLAARIADAAKAGAEVLSVTARPGNVSARNTERAGFALAYTKASFRPVTK